MSVVKLIFIFLLIKTSNCFDCGEVKVQDSTALSEGGKETYAGQWPWLAALFQSTNTKPPFYYFCGASLINKLTLLTAGHCLYRKTSAIKDPTAISPPQMQAVLGRHNISDISDKNGQLRKITKIVRHENYSPIENQKTPKSLADIALLIMTESVSFTDFIQPICLPSLSTEVSGIEGIVAGYGRSKASESSKEIAFSVELKTIELSECYSKSTHASKVVSEKSFCTQKEGATLCQGDSGSGFYNKNGRKWSILGIVSHAFDDQCNAGDASVFTRVSMFIDWIEEKSEGSLFFSNEFVCKNGSEISFAMKCNGIQDCDQNDESHDENTCVLGQLDDEIFSAEIKQKIPSSDFTIKSRPNRNIKSFKMMDSRQAKFLPIRVSETFPKLTEYSVEWCKINEVKGEHFVGLSDLKVLSLSENVITHIDNNAFRDLGKLEELFLDNNYLSFLPETLFENLKLLKTLDLNANRFKTFSQNNFKSLEKLNFLYLKHNKITQLDANIFVGLKNILEILLYGNEIEKITKEKTIEELRTLKVFDLRENKCFNKKFDKSDSNEIKSVLEAKC